MTVKACVHHCCCIIQSQFSAVSFSHTFSFGYQIIKHYEIIHILACETVLKYMLSSFACQWTADFYNGEKTHLISNEPAHTRDVDQENTWRHFIQSIMFTSSITFGPNQPLPWKRGEAVMLQRGFRGLGDLQGKKSFTKVKLCRTGKLNRTICRIGNFFGIAWDKELWCKR